MTICSGVKTTSCALDAACQCLCQHFYRVDKWRDSLDKPFLNITLKQERSTFRCISHCYNRQLCEGARSSKNRRQNIWHILSSLFSESNRYAISDVPFSILRFRNLLVPTALTPIQWTYFREFAPTCIFGQYFPRFFKLK
jgi:hypothetical protein